MHDPSNALNDDPGDRPPLASVDAATLAPQPEPGKHRAELYARLRNIIDNATESIRALKEENAALSARNAEMTDRIGVLERRIRAVTTDLADDGEHQRGRRERHDGSRELLSGRHDGSRRGRRGPERTERTPTTGLANFFQNATTDLAEDGEGQRGRRD